jgi:DNA-binding response OmpR family regulator
MAKILLIDDDPDIRTVMGMMLKKEGYDVETASRREEALEKISNDRPSIILLDVLLSGSDGRELCREIKANATTKHIPVIMFSGHPVAALQFESYGADDFIAKPFNTETLLSKLSRQMGEVK